MNLKKHNFNHNSFIGGWYIPKKVCNKLIDYFNNYKNKKEGKIVKGYQAGAIDYSIKKSIDLPIYPTELKNECVKDYVLHLGKCLKNYIKLYPFLESYNYFGLLEPLNIQYYPPGGGFYNWHCERQSHMTQSRVLVFMTYLNDVEKGGTDFHYQKITSPAKKGLTLIWPSDFTHTHKGQINKDKEKYIITGWFNFLNGNEYVRNNR